MKYAEFSSAIFTCSPIDTFSGGQVVSDATTFKPIDLRRNNGISGYSGASNLTVEETIFGTSKSRINPLFNNTFNSFFRGSLTSHYVSSHTTLYPTQEIFLSPSGGLGISGSSSIYSDLNYISFYGVDTQNSTFGFAGFVNSSNIDIQYTHKQYNNILISNNNFINAHNATDSDYIYGITKIYSGTTSIATSNNFLYTSSTNAFSANINYSLLLSGKQIGNELKSNFTINDRSKDTSDLSVTPNDVYIYLEKDTSFDRRTNYISGIPCPDSPSGPQGGFNQTSCEDRFKLVYRRNNISV